MATPEIPTKDLFNSLREISALITPFAGLLIALLVYIWNNRNRQIAETAKSAIDAINREREDREKADIGIIKLIEELEADVRASKKEVIDTFRDGIREERTFRADVLKQHDEAIKEIFHRINESSKEIERNKVSIEHVEKECLRHKQRGGRQ